MNTATNIRVDAEISAVVTKADGTIVDIGVISSPYNDRLRNWAWKKAREVQIRRLLRG